ncbi:hypothetical protein BWI17_01710 [Betaproteobacteria bacterium GR16-43]|nr:hypothetical protein BWI17_01710 [Betaproteobacteria bacterium GR16-43]
MPRRPRVFLPSVPCHVTFRGNNRHDIVRCDGDRLRLLDELRRATNSHELDVHAYVIMNNHVHLLVTGQTVDSLPKAMQSLGRRYIAYFNARHGRTGTLWEGRYKSSLVASEEYLFNCHRYIEQNPVRAGMVDVPGSFIWSSSRHYAAVQADDLVTAHEAWLSIGETEGIRRSVWAGLVNAPLADAVVGVIRKATWAGLAIGEDRDCERLESSIGRQVTAGERGWRKGRPRGQ